MKRIDFKEEVIKKESYIIEESVELHISKDVKKIESFAICGNDKTKKFYLSVYYEGTIEEFKKIVRGECYVWVEESDWMPSYGGSTLPQRYSVTRNWFKYVETPIIIHCSDGDYSEEYDYPDGYREYKTDRPAY